MPLNRAIQLAGLYESLLEKVQVAFQKLDELDELLVVRIRTTHEETLITPDAKITILVIQNPQDMIQK